jgi:hypothetical protein
MRNNPMTAAQYCAHHNINVEQMINGDIYEVMANYARYILSCGVSDEKEIKSRED